MLLYDVSDTNWVIKYDMLSVGGKKPNWYEIGKSESAQNLAENKNRVDSSVPEDGLTSNCPGRGGPLVVTTTLAVLDPHESEKVYVAIVYK